MNSNDNPRPKSSFALVDCDSFFVSCERLFSPELNKHPVVVLSSNDGCVVSRSKEAKALGVPMGAPLFKCRGLFKAHGVKSFSANFELYGDISQRVISSLSRVTPRTEVYSVDEAFLDLQDLDINNYYQWGQAVRTKLLKEVGVPVSIGIAPTKTLAKLAREFSKQKEELNGVLDLLSVSQLEREKYLIRLPIEDIWGVGRRLAPQLKAVGVFNAMDLANMSPQLAQQLMGIHGRQMVSEINGLSCYPMTPFSKVRQSVMHGRMFGEDTNQVEVIQAAIASLTARATRSLRREGLLAGSACLYLSTDRHKPGYQAIKRFIKLEAPSADTGLISSQLVAILNEVFSSRVRYHRANVLLYNLIDQDKLQTGLFSDPSQHSASQSRLAALDNINQRFDKGSIKYAAESLSSAWQPKHVYRSNRYTTSWQELPLIQVD